MANAKSLKDELDKYRRSYAAIVKRNADLENRYIKQEQKIQSLTSSLGNCQKALDINKNLLRQLGEEHGRKEKSLVEFMNSLKAKLRELGYDGNFDNLGD